ncbi:acyltransferase [Paracoccus marcusii]|uniref:acyltransferase family protein n=1 Tax=Paracoccus marcusii TaxID=59779 RepID=UPI003265670F
MVRSPPTMDRIVAFDGLRGVAAAIVVLFHYLCMLHPTFAPGMSETVHWLVDTPIHILWNGLFSVAVFFVLSGFVMAAAADRRHGYLVASSVARYLRLAVPAMVSCMLAWGWLAAFPNSADALYKTLDVPSRWLNYTYQGENISAWQAFFDGMFDSFIQGHSRFNNVLWTMKVELFGSFGLFFIYAFTQGRIRLLSLAISIIIIILWLPESYICFTFGAALYEAYRRKFLESASSVLPVLAFITAIAVGSFGHGAHLRLELLSVPEAWRVGQSRGIMHGIAATLLIYSVLTLPNLAKIFTFSIPQFLGRISFGLYLVHVPPLYTIVAWSYVRGLPEIFLGPIYAFSVIMLAWYFTLLVDEPSLKLISKLRIRIGHDQWLKLREKF